MTTATDAIERGGLAAGAWPVERLAVALAFLANGFVIGSWAPLIPDFAARLELGKPELGLMILAFGIGAIAAMPVVGRIISAYGSRPPLIVLHVALVLVLPMLAFAPSIPLGIAAVLFSGVATGGMDVAMNANAVSVERGMRRAMMSSCHGFWSIGGLIGAASGGFVIATFGPGAHGIVVGGIVLLALWPVMRHVLSDRVELVERGVENAGQDAPGTGLAGYGKALAIGAFALFGMIPEGAAIDWSATYLRQELGASIATSGLAFAAFSTTMAVLRFAGDGIRDRFGAVRTARICSLLAIAGLMAIGFAPGLPAALAGFALLGLGLSNLVPIAFSAAGNIAGLKAGAGLSVATTMGYSGILVAPSAIGFVAEHTGFAAVYAGLAVLLVAVFLSARLVAGADRASG